MVTWRPDSLLVYTITFTERSSVSAPLIFTCSLYALLYYQHFSFHPNQFVLWFDISFQISASFRLTPPLLSKWYVRGELQEPLSTFTCACCLCPSPPSNRSYKAAWKYQELKSHPSSYWGLMFCVFAYVLILCFRLLFTVEIKAPICSLLIYVLAIEWYRVNMWWNINT